MRHASCIHGRSRVFRSIQYRVREVAVDEEKASLLAGVDIIDDISSTSIISISI